MSSIIDRMLSKTAKAVTIDVGDGSTYTYDDKEPHGKEDAEFVKGLREPYGVGRSLVGGVLPALLSGLAMGGARYVGGRLDGNSHSDMLDKALLWGGTTSAVTLPIFSSFLYGKRNSMPMVLATLKGLRDVRASREAQQAREQKDWNSKDI